MCPVVIGLPSVFGTGPRIQPSDALLMPIKRSVGKVIVAVTGLEREGRIAASVDVRVMTCGANSEILRRKLAAALDDTVRGIISFGICGGLSPDLPPGTCIIASEIVSDRARIPVDAEWSGRLRRLLPQTVSGPVAGIDALLPGAQEKSTLFQKTAALGADMESHVAAELASAHKIPFACLRAIADPAWSALPPAATCAVVNENGTINKSAVLRSLLAHPGQVPDLVRLARESSAAFSALLRCRDLIGSRMAGPDFRQPALDMA
jgi:hopanoid-associated phosphorylase